MYSICMLIKVIVSTQGSVLMKMQQGFSLIELMIAVAIAGILATIAYPSYTRYVTKSNRSAAESFIMTVSNKQEQYMLDARQYATGATAISTLNLTPPPEVQSNYTITVVANNAATPPSYSITAQPVGVQLARDTACASLTIDQTGAKGISGPGSLSACW